MPRPHALLADAGAHVVVADLGRREEIGTFVETDVRDEASVQNAVDAAVGELGGLHGVVNCAGIGAAALVVGKDGQPHPLDAFRNVIDVNLVGTFNVIRLAAVVMAQNEPDEDGERGVIVNTASTAAWEGQFGQAAYTASKGGVVSLTIQFARELGRHGIRVMAIAPGPQDTPHARPAPRGHPRGARGADPVPLRGSADRRSSPRSSATSSRTGT